MSLFFQLVVSGLTTGAIYAALALALVLIFRATNVVNFGQGEMATFSAYGAWQLMQWGVPLWLAILVSLAASFAIGIVTFRVIIRPMMDAPVEAVVVITLGILVLFQAACMWIWGAEQLSFPSLFPDGGFSIGDVRVLASAVGRWRSSWRLRWRWVASSASPSSACRCAQPPSIVHAVFSSVSTSNEC